MGYLNRVVGMSAAVLAADFVAFIVLYLLYEGFGASAGSTKVVTVVVYILFLGFAGQLYESIAGCKKSLPRVLPPAEEESQ